MQLPSTHPILKIFIYTNIFLIIFIYSPVILYFAYLGVSYHTKATVLLCMLGGFLIWTLNEYIIHRFVFHGTWENGAFRKFQFFMHGYHHTRPTDPARLALPLIVTLPVTIIIYSFYKLIFGAYAESIMAGFLLGYVIYDITHYTIHRVRPRTVLGKFLRQYHFYHHFKDSARGFGVTSPLWDYVVKSNFE
jgi:dihydroceramide fatty acyl 2-hydroxylase